MNKFDCWLYNPATQIYKGSTPFQKFDSAPPGLYQLTLGRENEPVLHASDLKEDRLCTFSEGPLASVLNEINDFWINECAYEKLGITHKRGILLYGPPGCGKTGIIGAVTRDVIERNGIALVVNDVGWFLNAIPAFRQIQPASKIVVIMEDIEQQIEEELEEELLEALDGSSSIGNGVLFLATTNDIEKIPHRIRSRPSRIDTIIEIPYPSFAQREEYAHFLLGKTDEHNGLVKEVIDKTEDCTLADIKEIIISTVVFKKPLKATLERIHTARKAALQKK